MLEHAELKEHLQPEHRYKKIDELPFDLQRRRLSVVLEQEDGKHILISKGAVEEIFRVCTQYRVDSEFGALDQSHFLRERRRLSGRGRRLQGDDRRAAARLCDHG